MLFRGQNLPCTRVAFPQRDPMTIPLIENMEMFLPGTKYLPMLVRLVGQSKNPIALRLVAESTEETSPHDVKFQVIACSDVGRVLLAQVIPHRGIWRSTSAKKLLESINEAIASCG